MKRLFYWAREALLFALALFAVGCFIAALFGGGLGALALCGLSFVAAGFLEEIQIQQRA